MKIECEWLPIETAPTCEEDELVGALIAFEDGTVIYDEEFCRYRKYNLPYDPEHDGWSARPTHWMPVPKAPFIHPRFRHDRDE